MSTFQVPARVSLRPEGRLSTIVLLWLIVALTTGLWLSWRSDRAAVEFLVLTTAVVGIYIYVGNSGVVSFGHVGLMAVGGYASAIVTLPPVVKQTRLDDLPGWLSTRQLSTMTGLAVGLAAGAVAAAVFGLLVWRLSGLAASIATLTLMMIAFNVASGWEGVTGGRGALPGVPRLVSVPVTLASTIGAIALAALFQRSRSGRLLRATREDAAAADALGIPAERLRWFSLVLSGAVMGLSGALYVHFVGTVSPDFFFVSMLFTLLVMLVIGGMTSLTGAVLGTVAVRVLREVLAPLDDGFSVGFIEFGGKPGLRFVVLGVLLLVMLARRPGGLLRGHELTLEHPRDPVRAARRQQE